MNNMICDLKTGICGEAGDENNLEIIDFNPIEATVDLYYVTDPICSHCWALEPVHRRFAEQYGHHVRMHTVMGGLLESWDGFADAGNGIGKPSDVAGHWREVGAHSRMPIDGSLWLNNPIRSSYPPSRVFKIVQQESERLAETFLRRAREAVFVFNRNIGERDVLIDLVNQIGLDGQAIVNRAESEEGKKLLAEDFALARSLSVRGFPTIIMVNQEKKGVKIVGARELDVYVQALRQLLEKGTAEARRLPPLSELLESEGRLFSKELEVFYDLTPEEVRNYVQEALPEEAYAGKEIMGEFYIERKDKATP